LFFVVGLYHRHLVSNQPPSSHIKLLSADSPDREHRDAAAAIDHTLKILDGVDPQQFRRYGDLLEGIPLYQEWIKASMDRDTRGESKQREWLSKKAK
jgi:hypothetical protein